MSEPADSLHALLDQRDAEIRRLKQEREDYREKRANEIASLRARAEKAEREADLLRTERDIAISTVATRERERDEAKEDASVAAGNLEELGEAMDALRARAEKAERDAKSLRYQIECGGCAVSRIGELTYECSIEKLCGLCRLRGRAEKAEREVERLREALRGVLVDAANERGTLRARAEKAEREVERLREALRQVIDAEWDHAGGHIPEAERIARAALEGGGK